MRNLHIFVMLLALGLGYGCKKEEPKDRPLRVAMELEYPPFETTDSNGNPKGVSVDLATDFAKYLGKEVEIQNIKWTGLIPSLQTNKADVVISTMSITPKRKETVDFSDPYIKQGLSMLVPKESKIQSYKDIKDDTKVVVKTGTIGATYALANFKEDNIRQFDTVSACVLEIVQGRADAFIYDDLTLFKNQQKHPNTTKVIFETISGTENYVAMAFKKGNKELVQKANEFLKQYKKQGGFEKLSDKHLYEIKKEYEKNKLPFYFEL